MKQKRSGAIRRGTPTVTASDWADAALQLIAERGLAALTVTALAERLGVTKGSFYWHFDSRSELVAAALDRWEQRTTSDAVKALDAMADPRRRLELILAAASRPPRSRSLHAALAEAGDDPVVRRVLERVASTRIAYLESCYRSLGLSPSVARSRAVFAYAAYRGLLQLAREAPDTLPEDWPAYAAMVLETFVPRSNEPDPGGSNG